MQGQREGQSCKFMLRLYRLYYGSDLTYSDKKCVIYILFMQGSFTEHFWKVFDRILYFEERKFIYKVVSD